nr:MAG TPA: hypothetical protein [Caudoviricetes sp.]
MQGVKCEKQTGHQFRGMWFINPSLVTSDFH